MRNEMTELQFHEHMDLPAQVSALAAELGRFIDEASDVGEMVDILARWQALKEYFYKKTNSGRAALEAAQRRAELKLGHALTDLGDRPDCITSHDFSNVTMMARFESLVEREIRESTNAKPCTRSKALRAIRSHRIATGELVPRTRSSSGKGLNADEAAKDLEALEMRLWEIDKARVRAAARSGGTSSHLYQRIRQAQAEANGLMGYHGRFAYWHSDDPSGLNVDESNERYERLELIDSLLVKIEAAVVEIMQIERRSTERQASETGQVA